MGGNGVDVRARSLRVTFTWEGKQHRKTLQLNGAPLAPTPANIRYAERLAAEIREKIRLGLFSMAEYFPADGADVGDALTLEHQLNTWLDAQRVSDSTRSGYQSAIKFWGEALPGKALRALRLSEILRVVAARPDLTGKTINNYVSVLRQALDLAVDDKLLTENPAEGVRRAKHQKPPPDPFSREESDRIIQSMQARYPEQIGNLVEFWFWTGLRTSEIFALRWQNIDLASRTVLVTEAVVHGKRKDSTKTDKARTLHLNARAFTALQRQKKHTFLADADVFQDPRYGLQWSDERAFRRSFWTPTLKLLGVRYRRPYNMRHSYATAMLMAGMTPAFCAGQLGHSVEMFLRTYAKWVNGDQNDLEMQRLNATLSPIYPRETKTGT